MVTGLPPEFDANTYRNLHADLKAAGFDDAGMQGHYIRHGMDEGRACNTIKSRADFLALIPAAASVVEICPGFTPTLKGQGIKYYDTEDRASLVEQATLLHVQTSTIQEIDYVSGADDMSIVEGKYDVLLSVNDLGRHPNLIVHLQQCESLLAPGGMMFCVVPDKRYSYDYFTPETSLAVLLARYHENDNTHHLEHSLALGVATHYNGRSHWAGRHGNRETNLEARVNAILSGETEVAARHVNSSYFTPAGFRDILCSLQKLKLTRLAVERLYPPVYGNNEFYVVLSAQS